MTTMNGQGNQSEDDFPGAIGNPARRALAGAGFTHLAQLTVVTAAEIGRLHGVGPKAIRELTAALAARGMTFAVDEVQP